MKSFLGRSGPARNGSSSRRRTLILPLALCAGLIAGLATSVAALASTTTIPTDTATVPTGTTYTVQGGTDLPATSNGFAPAPAGYKAPANDGLGVAPGAIKHVWVIILENKAFTAAFTPLQGTQDTYLNDLPEEGALLTNYYGTGHSSLDNYLSMFSGQAPVADNQSDCWLGYDAMGSAPAGTAAGQPGTVNTVGSFATNPNYGQFMSLAGANAPTGDNGCVYPSTVPTLFNQLDAAHKTWKVYAQDLSESAAQSGASVAADGTITGGDGHEVGTNYCGAPDTQPGPAPTPTTDFSSEYNEYQNPSGASSNDGYVSKHNPLAWFQSVLNSGDCAEGLPPHGIDSDHLASLFGPDDALYGDLQHESTTPDLSVIIPDNCSNGHDANCANNAGGPGDPSGGNLSGGFEPGTQIPNAPTNTTGGIYSENLFLEHVIPEIEASPAFADNGLIIVTYDEAYQPFTWQNSFVNSQLTPDTAAGVLQADEAGETLYGRSLNWEPTGPNATIVTAPSGQVLTPGPGANAGLDRPLTADGDIVACKQLSTSNNNDTYVPASDIPTAAHPNSCIANDLQSIYETPTSFSATSTGSTIAASINIDREGMEIEPSSWPSGETFSDPAQPGYTGPYYIGSVDSVPHTGTASNGSEDSTTFTLVDNQGNPVVPSPAISGVTLHAQFADMTNDPIYDAFDPTLGGGDSGAVMISPLIKPGTVSNNYYNHYSLLRSLEDIFQVAHGSGTASSPDRGAPGYTGPIPISLGDDGHGHIGYAGQPGLAPFGPDIFDNTHRDR